ncbi:MAG: hypothetical protein QXO51_06205 [Halobacteria archaeon]
MAKPAPPPPQPSQTIHIGRKGAHSIEFDFPEVVYPLEKGEEVSLELKIVNHAEPAHVKLSVGGSLKEAVLIRSDSPYVKGEEAVPVILRLPKDARTPLKGEIAVTAGYGASRASFGVLLGDPRPVREKRGEREGPAGEGGAMEGGAAPAALRARSAPAWAREWRIWAAAALAASLASAALLASAGGVVETFAAAWVAAALMVALLLRAPS